MVVGITAYALPLVVGRDLTVDLVYGGEYEGISGLVALAGLQAVFLGVGCGAGPALTAARRTSVLLAIRLTTAAASAILFFGLAGSLGIIGAGWSGVLGSVAYAILSWTIDRWTGRRSALAAEGQEQRQEHLIR